MDNKPWATTTASTLSTMSAPTLEQMRRVMDRLTAEARAAELSAAEAVGEMECTQCGFRPKYEGGRIQLCPCLAESLRRMVEKVAPPTWPPTVLNTFCGIAIDVVDPSTTPPPKVSQ